MGDHLGINPRDWRIYRLFSDSGAWQAGHFVLTSELHSREYFDKRRISENKNPEFLREAGRLLTDLASGIFEVVVSPAEGAIPFGVTVAKIASTRFGHPVDYVTAIKSKGGFEIKGTGREKVNGKKVLLCEDIFTTGTSTDKARRAIHEAGGEVVLIIGLLDRSSGAVRELIPDIPLAALRTSEIQTWTEAECRRDGPCSESVPICTKDKVGHGKEYVAENGQPPYK